MPGFNMDDYVPVNERIEAFYKKHPDGSLQSEIVEHTETRVTVKAYAYRDRDDARPGTGLSSETIPGSTSFTKGSEVENAETSAWGRAIAALGFEVKRGIASREEMRRQQPERSERASSVRREAAKPATTSAPVRTPEESALIGELLEIPGMTVARMSLLADAVGIPKGTQANADQLRAMLERANDPPGSGVPADSPASQPSAMDGFGAAPVARGGEESSDLPAEPTIEDVLEVTGGELVDVVPPELQERIERAKAKGKAKEDEPSLAQQLGAPLE
jgi:hypothetical protein